MPTSPGPVFIATAALRGLAGEPGKGDHIVLLGVRLVALKARLVVRLVIELQIGGERRVLPLAVPDVVRILGAPPRALLHDRDADEVPLDEAPVSVLHRITAGITWALYWLSVSSVPLGMGLPSRAAFTASGVPYSSRYCLLS